MLSGLLQSAGRLDVTSLAVAAVVVLLVALLGALLPTLKAAASDPVLALRQE